MANNAVRFVYLSAGHPMPVPSDPNAIYFVEEAKQLWVGDKLIADHIDPVDVPSYLEPYEVKRLVVTGEGSIVVDTSFDSATGVVTVTKGNPPSISLSPTGTIPEIEPDSDVSVEVVTGLSVDGHTIHQDKAKIKFDSYMKAEGGTASDATVSLLQDPVEDMDAVTKRYVDGKVEGLSGAMHFLGISSTPITDGGREHPKIDGKDHDTSTLVPGDVVLYSPEGDGNYVEFVWKENSEGTGSWSSLGNEGAYALKGLKIIAGDGLAGGGTLAADVTLSLEPVEGGAKEFSGTTPTEVITGVERDEFGNLIGATLTDFEPVITEAVEEATETVKEEAIAESKAYTDAAIAGIGPSIDVVILGTGNALVDAVYDDETGTLTLTKGEVHGGEAPAWDVVNP